MTPVVRPPSPEVLTERAARWTAALLARRADDVAATFYWPEVDGIAVNQLVLPTLLRMTARHCAYCDHFELGDGSRETIDHFRPKSTFPEHAYAWENLFPACDQCQQHKSEDFHDDLLRPDSLDYRFDRYFLFNSRTGMIEVNPRASEVDQRRAAHTNKSLGGVPRELARSPEGREAVERWLRTAESRGLPSDEGESRMLDLDPLRRELGSTSALMREPPTDGGSLSPCPRRTSITRT